jgi:threonine dehydratase
MKFLQQLLGRKRRISQAGVARRAQAMIEHVIFDVGGGSLAGGTFVLDKAFRLRFLSATAGQCHGMIASVRVGDIAESVPFRAPALHAARDSAAMQAHSDSLALAVVREIGLQSAAFRALPLCEA